ncbi:anthranilate synthase component I family protein [Xanthovirga aplysinae]|uniref:anthranilate synthase component I family protein n=1 Tax=Xanthovirga aplysinae TaxID=2529853 RepID=UPI0012BCC8DA|nr:anthranilate synthase component I family protein [Xanthovirga aplysinae]MTI31174.1 anthranilate synthase component I family protein [Xanthovirga aplysinae]
MERREAKFYPEDISTFQLHALAWADQHFSYFHFFNGNQISYPNGPFPIFLAAEADSLINFKDSNSFEDLKYAFNEKKDWLIGSLGYDLKNQIEDLKSSHPSHIEFEDILFYTPKHLIFFEPDHIRLCTYGNPEEIFQEINCTPLPPLCKPTVGNINPVINKRTYLEKVNKIKQHIIEGDIYEMNFCQEFFSPNCKIDPITVHRLLSDKSPMPFSVFQKSRDKYLICASPERFLKKENQRLISQPIKGTIRRGKNKQEDEFLRQKLRNDEKELAENMMIVDLVRNDLAQCAISGTVNVDEIFGIYTFPQVHQMISTISAELRPDIHFVDAIKAAFPMGSMTGAPKIKVMELTEKYECSRRGLFSGAVGYISPDGDFDFNVVIRSIFYDSTGQKLSFQVGGAITYDSVPDQEYEECLLKAKAIQEVLATQL